MIDFSEMTRQQRIDAFEIILESVDKLRWGFDWVDDEMFMEWFKKLSDSKRQLVYDKFYFEGNIDEFHEFFLNDIGLRITLWRESFRHLNAKNQIAMLEEQESNGYYSKTKEIIDNKYDWNNFVCFLEQKGETSKLRQIKMFWNDLGMQVYGCRDQNDRLCPCLRECATSAAIYKCFRDYLQDKDLSPYDVVPIKLLSE